MDAASMVDEQLVPRGITNQRVLAAMRSVRRHRFVPIQYRLSAYYDCPLPIGYGQTISQPYIVALMTQLLETEPEATVLEIGTGSGYQAAVLAELVKHVYTVETIKELADRARKVLESEGYTNVTVYHRDGSYGLPEHAPYDRIMVTAAAPRVPDQLKDQLADGGVMVIPVGPAYGVQVLRQIRRVKDDFEWTDHEYVRFVPFTGGVSRSEDE